MRSRLLALSIVLVAAACGSAQDGSRCAAAVTATCTDTTTIATIPSSPSTPRDTTTPTTPTAPSTPTDTTAPAPAAPKDTTTPAPSAPKDTTTPPPAAPKDTTTPPPAAPTTPTDTTTPPPTTPSAPTDTTTTATPVTTGFVSKTFVYSGITYAFQVFIPADYNSAAISAVPVILFLHGSAEKGTDNVKQTTVGLGPVVKAQQATFPAIVVFPQAPGGALSQAVLDRILSTPLAQVMSEYKKSDPRRVYLTGLSYGGIHAYDIAYQNSTTFAAIVPISATICEQCITNDPTLTFPQAVQLAVGALKTVPIWQFHGATDTAIPVTEARAIRDAFLAAGAPYKYTEYPNTGHEIWDTVYADATMWSWLFSKSR